MSKLQKFAIRKGKDFTLLLKDGKPAICPFRNPFPQPSQIQGHFNLSIPTCSSECIFFKEEESKLEQALTSEPVLSTVVLECVPGKVIRCQVEQEGGIK